MGREQGLDVVNLGYAGSARGELPSAQEIATLAGDLITVAYGTNCWSRTPQSPELFEAGLHAFLDLVRTGHPETPIVAVSPILRIDAENSRNAFGASLADLRATFEAAVERRQKDGDAQLWLVPGRELVPEIHLPDGIHPDDEGHRLMARLLGSTLARAAREGNADA